ncbi:hypothetical protein M917_2644 [Psychrobacter aquaticus CMS 56]|uniref:Uncharacterized protein n=1 Tax=Psychrobacter aquaticus CMS 56 TaxID=1354303 RepID=U4T3A2_9GAMM|nr:hypothetical protein M917_2644 [Psychrobacter aquaticus CMS 56]
MASAQEVICEQCCLPSHAKLGVAGGVLNAGFTTGADNVSRPESTYVGGMSSKSVDVDMETGVVEVSVATSMVVLLVELSG